MRTHYLIAIILMAMGCVSAGEVPHGPRYFQDMAVTDRGPGFKLTKRIRREEAKPNENYFEAHYDSHGRIIRLRTLMKPEIVVSEIEFEYSDDTDVPSHRKNVTKR